MLKPNPASKEFIEVTLEEILLVNEEYINNKRKIIDEINEDESINIWCYNYIVTAHHLNFKAVKNDLKTEISIPVKLNLSIEKIFLIDELNFIFKQNLSLKLFFLKLKIFFFKLIKELDNTYKIIGAVSPVILRLYREDFLTIIKVMLHNIAYDDFNDKLFIYDFDIVSKYEPGKILILKKYNFNFFFYFLFKIM